MKNISFIGIFITILFLMIIYNIATAQIGPAIGSTILFLILSCLYLFNKGLEQNIDWNDKKDSTTTK